MVGEREEEEEEEDEEEEEEGEILRWRRARKAGRDAVAPVLDRDRVKETRSWKYKDVRRGCHSHQQTLPPSLPYLALTITASIPSG